MNNLLVVCSVQLISQVSKETNSSYWYIAGAVVAILIFGYLLAVLAKPEKF